MFTEKEYLEAKKLIVDYELSNGIKPVVIKSLPTDEILQAWGEDYADEHFEKSDNPLSKWWLEAETFTNGARAVIRHIEGNVL